MMHSAPAIHTHMEGLRVVTVKLLYSHTRSSGRVMRHKRRKALAENPVPRLLWCSRGGRDMVAFPLERFSLSQFILDYLATTW